MRKEQKRGILGVSILAIHFGFLFFYSAPAEVVGNRLPRLASHYALPLFHQNWNLFAPEPPQWNYDVQIVFEEEKYTQNICSELLEKHHTFRTGPSGRVSMSLQNSIATLHQLYVHQHPGTTFLREDLSNTLRSISKHYYPERKAMEFVIKGNNPHTLEEIQFDL